MSLFSNDLSKEPVFDGIGYEPSFFFKKDDGYDQDKLQQKKVQ